MITCLTHSLAHAHRLVMTSVMISLPCQGFVRSKITKSFPQRVLLPFLRVCIFAEVRRVLLNSDYKCVFIFE